MEWKLTADRPVYLQLIEHFELAIAAGSFQSGARLPSVRELAADASVNPNTMQKALQELETRGLVSTRRTAGRFITEERERIDMLRNTKAEEQLQNFLESMKKLGFDRDETLKLLTKKLKEKD